LVFEVPPLVPPLVLLSLVLLPLVVVPLVVVPLLGALVLELVDGVPVDELLAEGAVVDVPADGVLEEDWEPELLE
jgi:hypothetical protein